MTCKLQQLTEIFCQQKQVT